MRVVIFCGGFGTRMWPASRKSYPKQFYPLIGGKSFFEITFERFRSRFALKDIFVSTEGRYLPFIKKLAPQIPKENIIAEPERRDNLGAIGLVTAILEKRFPGEVMIVSWSDQLIGKEKVFLDAVTKAADYAKETGFIVSVDEKPGYPSVHNGWVKLGENLDEYHGLPIVRIVKHIEKPESTEAKRMFVQGGYLLNTGYRAWRTDVMLGYFREFQPEIYSGLTKIMDSYGTKSAAAVIAREYHKFPKDSIESGIFEKLPDNKRVTIPVDMAWEDAGTWELFFKALRSEEGKSVILGTDAYEIEAKDNLIVGSAGKMIGVIGLERVAVIDTPDGLLVAKLDKTGLVKELFKYLEEKKSKYVD